VAGVSDHFSLTVGQGAELTDDAALGALVDRVAASLGGCEPRVAASITFLGIAARLWAVAIRSALDDGGVPDLARLMWTDDRGSVRLHAPVITLLDGVDAIRGDPEQLIWEQVLEGHLRGLLRRTQRAYGLAEGLLWGNVASGLEGLAKVEPETRELTRALLQRPPLDMAMDGPRRRSCCLFYKVPGAGLCGDCVLDTVPARLSG
jgi:hypothetical protein